MLLDFLAGTGIPKEQIFCSSLPGNDIGSRISAEVKDALKNSALNIAILSHDYYQSAYCFMVCRYTCNRNSNAGNNRK